MGVRMIPEGAGRMIAGKLDLVGKFCLRRDPEVLDVAVYGVPSRMAGAGETDIVAASNHLSGGLIGTLHSLALAALPAGQCN